MARKKKVDPIDAQIEQLYYKHGQNLNINVMDIGNIFKAGRLAHSMGTSVEEAIIAAIKVYCKA